MFKWSWSKKKKEADKSQEVERCVMRNTLTIRMVDGSELVWNFKPWKGKGKIEPWIRFYKWYFGKESEHYVLGYKQGETMFKRADIKSFNVEVKEVKDSA